MQNQQERDSWLSWLRYLTDEKLSILRDNLEEGFLDEKDILPCYAPDSPIALADVVAEMIQRA